jgi:GAF domain-containing protein
MLRYLRPLFRVQHYYSDLFARQRAIGLFWIAWSAVAAIVALTLYSIVLKVPLVPFVYIYIVALGVLAAIITLINWGNLSGAGVLFVGMVFAASAAVYAITGTPGLIYFSLPIVTAGVLLGRRWLSAVVVVTSLTILLITAFQELGLLAAIRIPPVSAGDYASFAVLVMVILGLVLGTFAGGQRTVLRRNLMLTAELRTAARINNQLSDINRLDDLLTRTIETIRDQLGYYHVQIFLMDEKTNLVVQAMGSTLTRGEGAEERRITPDSPSVINDILRSGVTKRITLDDPEALRNEFLPPTLVQLLIPLRQGKQIIGVLDVQSVNRDVFTEQEIEGLESIAAQIGLVIGNIRLADQLETTRQEAEGLNSQLQTVVRELNRLDQEASGRTWERQLRRRPDRLISYTWNKGVLTSAQPTDAAAPLPTGPMPETRMVNDEQILVVPIALRGQILGVMEFAPPPGQEWSPRHIELARAISQRLALSLDNIRLFEQAQVAAAREQIANQIAARLQAETEVDSLLAAATGTFQQALGATRTSIRLGPPERRPAGDTNDGSQP